MKIRYSYQQHCIAECTGVLDVPNEIISQGDAVVHEYIREHEVEAKFVDNDVKDWNNEVEGSMEFEADL